MPQHRQDSNLDLLRATAVLMVVVFHVLLSLGMVAGRLGWLMGLGRWAVLIFFVHTSLVLMFSLERQSATAAFGWRHYLAFLLRRCFRLLPLSTVVIATVVALDLPVASVHHGHFAAVHPGVGGILANVFLVQNLTGTDSVMGTLWSLPFEMQMYLALPFAYAHRRPARRPAIHTAILAIWAVAAIASAVTTRFLHHLDFLSYVPCFLPGVMAFALHRATARAAAVDRSFRSSSRRSPRIYVVTRVEPVAWLACLALGCAIPWFRDMPAGRLWRACHLVARYSYGIYLTHFILIWVFFVRLAGSARGQVRWIGFWRRGGDRPGGALSPRRRAPHPARQPARERDPGLCDRVPPATGALKNEAGPPARSNLRQQQEGPS